MATQVPASSSRLRLFPVTARVQPRGELESLTIAGCDLAELADQFGTPLYLYDQTTLDAAVSAYRSALEAAYPGPSGLTYAGKAFLCLALVQWIQRCGLWLDCTGVGELMVAASAGLARKQILVHGVNKSPADLAAAFAQAGTIVVDSLTELSRLAQRQHGAAHPMPKLWLRVRPGLAADTHIYTQTGQEDSKFGMDPMEVMDAVQICTESGLPLTGLHFHQGSHFRDLTPLGPALDLTLDLMAELRDRFGWLPEVLCPGGGLGCAYHEGDLPYPRIEEYVRFVAEYLVAGCRRRALALPMLQLEPGRSLVAPAGVALYRVGAVKQTPHRRWLLLDGGLADNPRPALYGARYTALPVTRPRRLAMGSAWFAGPYCESSDILIEDLPFPDIQAGELVAIPVSGAYQLSMASNYNGACKPAVLWLYQGSVHLIREREQPADLVHRDRALWVD